MSDPVTDPTRLDALAETGLMDSPAEAAFDRLTRLATRLLDAPVGLISLVAAERQYFKSAVGLEVREVPLSHSFCQHVVRADAPLVVTDARRDPRVADNPAVDELHVVAYAGVPLRTAQGETLGSFCAIDTAPREWRAEDVALLEDLAAGVMTEIALRTSNERLYAAEREAAARASHLESVVEAMTEGYALLVGGRIVDVNAALCRLTGFAREELIGARAPFPFGVSDAGAAAAGRAGSHRGGSYETVFQRADGSRFAAEVTTRPARHPDGSLLGLVHTVRDISDRKRREEELRRLANRDTLTGLPNRRAFEEQLASEVARARRHDHPFSLAILDVDHFKAVNDRHGHPIGDLVLREVATRIASVVRDGDTIARIGGEEFAWLLPDAGTAGARAAAERARAAMTARPFAGVGRVTVSVGVCELPRHADADALVSRADEALYAAKRGGRNRTVALDPPAPAEA
jgi:diguanylate cyclase (GGDEF)-like protein/PAS domain S-box-containing protein